MDKTENISCPLCGQDKFKFWATENEFKCVCCEECGLLYVNPRPNQSYIDETVKLGSHTFEDGTQLITKTRRSAGKKQHSGKVIKELFSDLLDRPSISWLDVGAGYGEFLEALISVCKKGSQIEGLEPMQHKAQKAKEFGLPVTCGYVRDISKKYDVVSIIDVFSHIPEFPAFLSEIKQVLNPEGEILVKTGNAADIGDRRYFPGPLNLPDHLMFGGVSQVTRFLNNAGFEVVTVKLERIDGVWYSFKNLIKYIIGKPVALSLPYTSPTRTMWVRARLMN